MSNNFSLTIVIATLGGQSLASTIQSINSSSVLPNEILVCIPKDNLYKINHLQSEKTIIIPTEVRGQVAQRIQGFLRASNPLVMQMDDDLLLDKFCVEQLVKTINFLDVKTAVAPALLDIKTCKSVYKKPAKSNAILSLYYLLMNGLDGYRPGCIDRSGSSVGVDPFEDPNQLHYVKWLAGGCVLHRKENLIFEDFWPLSGKAYYEDVVHSSLLVKNGIQLVIDPKANCYIELFREADLKMSDFFRNLFFDFLGRRYFMRRFSRQSLRIYVYYFIRVANYFFTRYLK